MKKILVSIFSVITVIIMAIVLFNVNDIRLNNNLGTDEQEDIIESNLNDDISINNISFKAKKSNGTFGDELGYQTGTSNLDNKIKVYTFYAFENIKTYQLEININATSKIVTSKNPTGFVLEGNKKINLQFPDSAIIEFKVKSVNGNESHTIRLEFNDPFAYSEKGRISELEVNLGTKYLISNDSSKGLLKFDKSRNFYGLNTKSLKLDRSYINQKVEVSKLVFANGYNGEVSGGLLKAGRNNISIIVKNSSTSEINLLYIIEILVENSEVSIEDVKLNSNSIGTESKQLPKINYDIKSYRFDVITSGDSKYTKSVIQYFVNDKKVNTNEFVNDLKMGDNEIKIVVIAEDMDYSSAKTINYKVEKVDPRSKDTSIHDVLIIRTIGGKVYAPTSNDGSNYVFDVPNGLYNIKINVVTDEKARIVETLPGLSLEANKDNDFYLGKDKVVFEFKILAENGTKSELITITINKIPANAIKDISMLNLSIDSLNLLSTKNNNSLIKFEQSKLVYDFFTKETKLNQTYIGKTVHIEHELSYDFSSFIIVKNEPLVKGENNQIIFKVVAEDKSETVYQVNILVQNSEVKLNGILVNGQSINIDKTKLENAYHNTTNYSIIVNMSTESKFKDSKVVCTLNGIIISQGNIKDYLFTQVNNLTITIMPEDQNIDNTIVLKYTIEKIDERSNEKELLDVNLKEDSGNVIKVNKINKYNFEANALNSQSKLNITFTVSNLAKIVQASDSSIKADVSHHFTLDNKYIIKFKVQAENESISDTYTITIVQMEKSNENYLLDLEVTIDDLILIGAEDSNPLLVFNKDIQRYELITGIYKLDRSFVGKSLSININKISDFATSSIIGTQVLVAGTNQINIIILSQNGLSKQYSIEIFIENSKIKVDSITVEGNEIDLSEASTENGITLDSLYNDKDFLEVNVKINESIEYTKGTIIIEGNDQLVLGNNIIVITIYSEDGTMILVYTINLYKQSNDNSLSNVIIDEESFDNNHFTNNTMTLKMEYIKGLEVELVVVPTDLKAFYTIDGLNLNNKITLKHGTNVISFIITSESGIVELYSIEITTISNANSILDITVDGKDLKPGFKDDVFEYEFFVKGDILSAELEVRASDYTTIFGNGNASLQDGDNFFEVYAVSESNIKGLVYRVNIIRLKNDTTIDEIIIDDIDVEFDPITKEAYINYPYYEGASIDIEITLTKGKSVIGDGVKALVHRVNKFIIVITAEDKTEEVYTLYVDALYDDHNITSFIVDKQEIITEDNKYDYALHVTNVLSTIEIIVGANKFGVITIEKQEQEEESRILDEGINTYLIYVTSEYGTKGHDYILNIVNTIIVVDDNLSDAYLIDLYIDNYVLSPNFNPVIYNYSVTVNNKNIIVNYTKAHDDQTVVISDNINNLQLGENKVILTVTSADETVTAEYEIIINVVEEKTNAFIIILIILLILFAIILTTYIIKKTNKNNKKPVSYQAKVSKK